MSFPLYFFFIFYCITCVDMLLYSVYVTTLGLSSDRCFFFCNGKVQDLVSFDTKCKFLNDYDIAVCWFCDSDMHRFARK
jgi:hypothetical protein